jgi:hypothetical protein
MYIQYIQGLFQSMLGTADYALVTSSLHYNDSLDTSTVIHMTAAKFKPLVFSVSGLVQCSKHFHSHEFGWLLLVACMSLLRNNKRLCSSYIHHLYLYPFIPLLCSSNWNSHWKTDTLCLSHMETISSDILGLTNTTLHGSLVLLKVKEEISHLSSL